MGRLERVLGRLQELELDGLLVTKPVNTAYLTGFFAATYSRPIMVLVARASVLVVPELEGEHAAESSVVADIRRYSDTSFGQGPGRSTLAASLRAAGRGTGIPKRIIASGVRE